MTLRMLGLAAALSLLASAAHAEIKTQWVEYSHGDVKLKGYLAYDDSLAGKRPAEAIDCALARSSSLFFGTEKPWPAPL